MISKWRVFGLAIAAGALLAQNPGIQRTVLTRQDISVQGREAIVARVEVTPGSTSGRHTHPGEEISYILEGEGEVLVDGQATIKLKPGVSFVIPARAKHEALNTGTQTLKLVGVYVVDKGQPLATPVQ